jgi:hypothetical protein
VLGNCNKRVGDHSFGLAPTMAPTRPILAVARSGRCRRALVLVLGWLSQLSQSASFGHKKVADCWEGKWADGGAQSGSALLGKQTLCQLSYSRSEQVSILAQPEVCLYVTVGVAPHSAV